MALIEFWRGRGDFSEGRTQLERVIVAGGGADAPRARALGGAGLFAWMQSDFSAASAHLNAGIKLWRALGDTWELAYPLVVLGWVNYQTGHYATGNRLVEESVTLSRVTHNRRVLGLALTYLGAAAFDRGDYPTANRHFAEALPVLRESGDRWDLASALTWMGHGLYAQGNFQQATALGEEALELYQAVGEKWGIAWVLQNLGGAACARKDYARAIQHYTTSLTAWRDLETPVGILHVLAGLARVKLIQGQMIQAACLFSAVETQLKTIGAALFPLDRREYERNVVELQAQLDPAALATAWETGGALSLEQAIALATDNHIRSSLARGG